jgi:hypothetical protein
LVLTDEIGISIISRSFGGWNSHQGTLSDWSISSFSLAAIWKLRKKTENKIQNKSEDANFD